jgi:hypothetical protein
MGLDRREVIETRVFMNVGGGGMVKLAAGERRHAQAIVGWHGQAQGRRAARSLSVSL